MGNSFRIFTPSTVLSSRAIHTLESAGAEYQIVTAATDLMRPAKPDGADLLYVPENHSPDSVHAANMISNSSTDRFGILSDVAGLVIHNVGSKPLSLFYRSRSPQADVGAYTAGADYRARGTVADVPMPRQIYLGLTQRCNRSCKFCVSRTFDFDLLSIDQVNSLCDELAGKVQVIALTGAGEAMTHPRFWEILDLLQARLPGVVYKMNTSGVTLARNADRLLEYPIKNITVSLNAATTPTYEKFVGKGFPVVLNGIETLVRRRAEMNRDDLHLCLSMVLMNSTVGETEQLATIAAQLGVEEIQGIYLMINDDVLAQESLWHQPQRSNELLRAAAAHAAALGVRASLPPPFQTAEMRTNSDQHTSLPTTQGQRCTEAWSTAYVRPDGEIMSCPYMDRTLGNIREHSLEQIWHGDQYTDLRRSLVDGDRWPECRNCCGFNESGSVDEYPSHWLGARRPMLPLTVV
ncbi:radical SAM/SPASM domain-containing protein [Nocardia sp. NBC_01388]|uniref:radical SAM/SPASM domain-containing protein n=1 Tax=Nocardia sp. NBC_01388 TaxID=2903596 RepID=UPI003253E05C